MCAAGSGYVIFVKHGKICSRAASQTSSNKGSGFLDFSRALQFFCLRFLRFVGDEQNRCLKDAVMHSFRRRECGRRLPRYSLDEGIHSRILSQQMAHERLSIPANSAASTSTSDSALYIMSSDSYVQALETATSKSAEVKAVSDAAARLDERR